LVIDAQGQELNENGQFYVIQAECFIINSTASVINFINTTHCQKVKRSFQTIQGDNLVVVFATDNSCSSTYAIMAGSICGAFGLLILVFIILVLTIKPLRHKFMPYRFRTSETQGAYL